MQRILVCTNSSIKSNNYGGVLPCEIVVEKHRSWFPNDIDE